MEHDNRAAFVDLLRTEPKVLQKYMGREQAAAFIAYIHNVTTADLRSDRR